MKIVVGVIIKTQMKSNNVRKNFNELFGFLRIKGRLVSISVDDTTYRTICNMIYNIECLKLDKESCEYRRTKVISAKIISKDIPVFAHSHSVTRDVFVTPFLCTTVSKGFRRLQTIF